MTLRVAYLCTDPGVPAFGTKGASVHVQEIIRAWRDLGADVHLYCTRLGDDVPADLAGLPVTHARVGRGIDPAERERAQADAAGRLARAVVEDGADVVYERYSLFSTALADIGERSTTGPPLRILEVNSPLVEEQRAHRCLHAEAEAWSALRAQADAADRLAAVSPPVAEWVARHTDAGERTRVVANGVNVHRIRPADPALRGAAPVVVFVGTLKPWHGIETLLQAAARARAPWRLRIVGDGPLRTTLREQATALGVDVDFRGAVAPEHMGAQLADASVAVAPYPSSEDHYFSPLKIYEYAAAALPVVASAIGQVPHIVRDGVSGLLVPPSDPVALAAAIDDLAGDPDRAHRMGRAGRERAVREHSWARVLDRILDGLDLPGTDAGAAGERAAGEDRIPEIAGAGGRRG